MNESFYDEAVCRTAPAAPDLLNSPIEPIRTDKNNGRENEIQSQPGFNDT